MRYAGLKLMYDKNKDAICKHSTCMMVLCLGVNNTTNVNQIYFIKMKL